MSQIFEGSPIYRRYLKFQSLKVPPYAPCDAIDIAVFMERQKTVYLHIFQISCVFAMS